MNTAPDEYRIIAWRSWRFSLDILVGSNAIALALSRKSVSCNCNRSHGGAVVRHSLPKSEIRVLIPVFVWETES